MGAVPGLRFNFTGGYEDTRLANGQKAVDLMDRTAGNTRLGAGDKTVGLAGLQLCGP